MYKDVDGISGATILGDGEVALIVDVAALVRLSASSQGRAELGDVDAGVH